MVQYTEEQTRIVELQELLIDRFVEYREAAANGEVGWAKDLEAEIDILLKEKREIDKWVPLGLV
jgi:hypothetical protein